MWECFVRSRGRGSYGYIKRLMEFWDDKALNKRSQASVLSQIKSIEQGGLLSEYEKCEIERLVRSEESAGQKDNANEEPAGQEDSLNEESAGQENNVNNVYSEETRNDDLMEDDEHIDFNICPNGNQRHSIESFVGRDSELDDDVEDHELDIDPEIHIQRLDIFEKGDSVRVTNEEENKIIMSISPQNYNSNSAIMRNQRM